MKFSEMQKLFSEKLDIIHLSDIARELSVSPQVINNWKKRDKIPYKYVKKIRQIEEVNEKGKSFNNNDLEIISSLTKLGSSNNLEADDVNIMKEIITALLMFKKILLNNFRFIISFTFITIILTAVYVLYFAPIVYKTSMTILPIKSDRNNNRFGSVASQFGVNLNQSSSNISDTRLIPDLIKSKSLLESLISRKIQFSNKKEKISLLEHYYNLPDSMRYNRNFYAMMGIRNISSNISVQKRKRNDLIDITVSFSDPKAAVEICFGIFEELDKIQKKINLSRVKEKISYISERLSTVRGDLKIAEEALKNFRENNRKTRKSPSLMLAENRLIREVASISAIYNTLKSEFEISRIDELGSSRLIQMIDKPSKPIYRSSPRRTRSVIIAMIIGFSVSLAVSYTRELYPKIRKEIS